MLLILTLSLISHADEVQENGFVKARIKVRQSYIDGGQFVETLSTEEVLLKPVGDSFEAVKMTIVQKVLSPSQK